MPIRGARIALCLGGVIAALVLAITVLRVVQGLVPGDTVDSDSGLCGESSFDFGVVAIESQPARLEHVFEITNCSEAPITISRAIASCGCTVVEVPDSAIEIGGTARVPVVLTLSDPGSKSARVALEIDGAKKASFQLLVMAIGYRSKQLRLQPSYIELRADGPERLSVFAVDQDSTSAPDALECSAPDELAVVVGPWELVTLGAPERGLPTRWETKLGVSLRRSTGARRDAEELELRVKVRGFPDVLLKCRLPNAEGSIQR